MQQSPLRKQECKMHSLAVLSWNNAWKEGWSVLQDPLGQLCFWYGPSCVCWSPAENCVAALLPENQVCRPRSGQCWRMMRMEEDQDMAGFVCTSALLQRDLDDTELSAPSVFKPSPGVVEFGSGEGCF